MANFGGLLRRMNDIAAHYDAINKWARRTPEQGWAETVRTQPAPKPPFGVPSYVFVKPLFDMDGDRFDREVLALYKQRTKAPQFAKFLFRDFPPGLTAADISFVGPDSYMTLGALAQRAVDVQIAEEERLDYPNNLTPEQLASLTDHPGDTARVPNLKERIAASLEKKRLREEGEEAVPGESVPEISLWDAFVEAAAEINRKLSHGIIDPPKQFDDEVKKAITQEADPGRMPSSWEIEVLKVAVFNLEQRGEDFAAAKAKKKLAELKKLNPYCDGFWATLPSKPEKMVLVDGTTGHLIKVGKSPGRNLKSGDIVAIEANGVIAMGSARRARSTLQARNRVLCLGTFTPPQVVWGQDRGAGAGPQGAVAGE